VGVNVSEMSPRSSSVSSVRAGAGPGKPAASDNPFFPLRPGMRWSYRSTTPDGVETTAVAVATKPRTIMGVPCVEVRDTVRVDGALTEDTLDWYA
jgi:hypothetical protein